MKGTTIRLWRRIEKESNKVHLRLGTRFYYVDRQNVIVCAIMVLGFGSLHSPVSYPVMNHCGKLYMS